MELRTQISVATIVPLLLTVSIVIGVGYLMLNKSPQMQTLGYAPGLITLGSCLLYFWLVVFDNNRTKRQISQYLSSMNQPVDRPKAEGQVEAQVEGQVEVRAHLERIITLLEQSNELASGGNKELMTAISEVVHDGLKKHATTILRSNNQHIEYMVSSIASIVSEHLKPGIDDIISELTRTNKTLRQSDTQGIQTSIQQLVNAISDIKSFKDDLFVELARLAETLNVKQGEYDGEIKGIIGQLQLLPGQMHSTYTQLATDLSAAINDMRGIYTDARESTTSLAAASTDVRLLTAGLAKSTYSQERLCLSFNDLFKKVDDISILNTQLLEKEKNTIKALETTIEKTLTNLVIQTDIFTVRTTEGLNRFINDVTSGLSKTSGSIDNQNTRLIEWTNSIDQHISKLSTQNTTTQEGFKKLIALINSAIEKQANTLGNSSKAVNLIRESAVLLLTASADVRLITEGLVKSTDIQERLGVNFNNLLKEIEAKGIRNSQLLEKEINTFNALEDTIERLLSNLVTQTDAFTGRTTEGLNRFINDITSGLSGSVNGLRGVINIQTELVDEISSTMVQLNDKLKG
ncbi:MAG: hypothetical protein HQL03_02350 [Nitrospirae bacterium]|nr:hypothetical protein [Nitrospirota bacterium]